LIATEPLEYGQRLFHEDPFLCCPSPLHRKTLCHHCLRPLHTGAAKAQHLHTGEQSFCSEQCQSLACQEYAAIQSKLDLSDLHAYCNLYGEKFPLLAARLACKLLQQSLQQQSSTHSNDANPSICSRQDQTLLEVQTSKGQHQDLLSSLRYLCHANIPSPPPEPWQESFTLLKKVLGHFLQQRATPDLFKKLAPLVSQLDLKW
jgi:hypothetical protein